MVTVWAELAKNSTVDPEPSVMVGLFVELKAAVALPENPTRFEVLKVPFMVGPVVPGNVITEVPAFMVELAATVSVLEAAIVIAKFPVVNVLPVVRVPTAMLPATRPVVTAALRVAPEALVLFI